MKKILLLLALFFIAGCSENKSKENNISESPRNSSKVANQEDTKQIDDIFSISNSIVKEYTQK
ncbi:hypothetical protein I4Q36_02400 [Tuanshanicoccus lijuaniae]|uniref:hypothetical protein n=1 Tax=Aerococcaceae bacterium zg-1292 TaxID=2774330 RepID=UPI001936CCB3|nr:hypothetical protein [Aerococcaceae bacterium zg-BR9]MBF6626272.1 hypothetical protein [Aerococcaceae bacterium zg-BR9]QQA37587.1 hypothetical protein I4Q36_02400 [Aerococcaceae bacterium zg-1292]